MKRKITAVIIGLLALVAVALAQYPPYPWMSLGVQKNGYISFSLAGSSGYGIRDLNGVLQWKNAGGTWSSFSSALPTHAFLSASHSDTTAAAVTRGALIYGHGSTPLWTSLALGSAGQTLIAGATEPSWADILSAVPTGLTYTTATRALSLTTGYMIPGAGSSGQILMSAGASAPAWTTPTFSVTATAGNALIGDGTNWTSANVLSSVPTGLTYTTATRALSFTSGYALYGTSNVTPVNAGGTGAATFALNGILYGNGTNAIGATAIGTEGQFLRVGANPFVPAWSATTAITELGTVTTGTWYALVKKTVTNSGNNATVDLTAAGNCYGQVYTNTGNDSSTHYDLPAAVVGMSMTFYVNYAGTLVLDPYAGDQFMVITSAADDTLTSDAVLGTFISFVCIEANKWVMVGMNGSWIES